MAALRYIAIFGVIVAIVALGVYGGGVFDGGNPTGSTEDVVINGKTFHLEVAADDASIEKGLMFRDSIPEDGGMLFLFRDYRVRNFWMKNCLVDIDVCFLDELGTIVAMHEMSDPGEKSSDMSQSEWDDALPRYSSNRAARFAIELRAGTMQSLGLKVGDRLDLDLSRLKRMAR